MRRTWRRVYRARGMAPFGLLLAVLLAVLVAADRTRAYRTHAEQAHDFARQRLAAVQATLDRSRRIDAALASAHLRLSRVAKRIVIASDRDAASRLLARSAQDWIASLGGRPAPERPAATDAGRVAARDVGPAGSRAADGKAALAAAKHPTAVAAASVSARMMPRQLLRMLERWPQAPLAMRLVRLEVTVDNPHTPTALNAKLRVEAVYRSRAQAASDRARAAPEPTQPNTP